MSQPKPKTTDEVVREFLAKNGTYFRNPVETGRIFSKGKRIEVVYVVVSKGIPLFRTEGVGDVTTLDIALRDKTLAVPAILPEKVQAKLRRRMLEILRGRFNDKVREQVKRYKDLGFTRIGEEAAWNCHVMPPSGEREADLGMCGFCPTCNILGTVITKSENDNATTSYGLKSRVVHDVAFGTVPYETAVIDLTHNKVGDGVSYTGRSLFEESHVVPGVVFVGKLAMYDVTEREAKLVLHALSSISRMGGGETKFGSVQVIVVGLKAGDRETISAYDVARHVLEKTGGKLVEPENVITTVVDYIQGRGFTILVEKDKRLDSLDTVVALTEDDVLKLWAEDSYFYANNVVEFIKRAEGKTGQPSRRRQSKAGKDEESQ